MYRLIAIVLLCLTAAETAAAQPAGTKRPNILFLLTDDQRWDTIGALGNPHIQTPHLDRLVQNGFVFTNAYCMGSMVPAVCLPSRTMLMTGKSLFHIPAKGTAKTAPAGVPLLPRALADAGYITYRTGKRGNTFLPANEAFHQNVYDEARDALATQRYADRVIEYLNQVPKDKPFYVQVSFSHPHDPCNAPEQYRKMYPPEKMTLAKSFLPQHPFDNGELYVRDEKLAPLPRTPEAMREHLSGYYAVISFMDTQIGRILAALEKNGQASNTIIVFSSDQGLAVGGMHGLMGKQNLYEHNKPPLFFTGPEISKGRSDALVYLFDLFPTLCDLTGTSHPQGLDGHSLTPILQGKQTKVRDYAFGAYRDVQRMVRDDRWKLLKYNAGGTRNAQLFDLKHDPEELVNLAADPQHRDQVTRMEKLLAQAQKWAADPLDGELNRKK